MDPQLDHQPIMYNEMYNEIYGIEDDPKDKGKGKGNGKNGGSTTSGLSDLERRREANIRRNEEFLASLGLDSVKPSAPRTTRGRGKSSTYSDDTDADADDLKDKSDGNDSDCGSDEDGYTMAVGYEMLEEAAEATPMQGKRKRKRKSDAISSNSSSRGGEEASNRSNASLSSTSVCSKMYQECRICI